MAFLRRIRTHLRRASTVCDVAFSSRDEILVGSASVIHHTVPTINNAVRTTFSNHCENCSLKISDAAPTRLAAAPQQLSLPSCEVRLALKVLPTAPGDKHTRESIDWVRGADR